MDDPNELCICGHTYGQHEWMDDALYGHCSKCDCHEFIADHEDNDELLLWDSQDMARVPDRSDG